jgi:hypothetical protein
LRGADHDARLGEQCGRELADEQLQRRFDVLRVGSSANARRAAEWSAMIVER